MASGELTAAISTSAVGRAGRDALHAIANAYRDYAKAHPGRYAATVRRPAPEDAELVAANEALLAILLAALGGDGITGDSSSFGRLLDESAPTAPPDERSENDAIDAIRTLRAVIHGFVTLEAAGGFGLQRSLDATYSRVIDALDTAFTAWTAVSRGLVGGPCDLAAGLLGYLHDRRHLVQSRKKPAGGVRSRVDVRRLRPEPRARDDGVRVPALQGRVHVDLRPALHHDSSTRVSSIAGRCAAHSAARAPRARLGLDVDQRADGVEGQTLPAASGSAARRIPGSAGRRSSRG